MNMIQRIFKYVSSCLILITFLFLGVGCRGPVQRNLLESPLEKIRTAPRDVVFNQINVVDTRTEQDKISLKPEMRYFIPGLIFFAWASEGHVRPDSTLYSLDVPTEMQGLVKRALTETGIEGTGASPNAMQVNLDVEITQLYSITHSSSTTFAGSGAASSSTKTFAPYGYAAAKITLKALDGTVILRRSLIGVFSPKLAEFRGLDFNPTGVMTNKLTMAAVFASGDLASNIARALEPVLTNLIQPRTAPVSENRAFYISRATNDGQFVEIACIDKASGQVLSSTINQRWMEPYVAVDEWVLDPYQGGDARLTQEEYNELVAHLQGGFDVRFVTDVRTAHFFGKK